MDVLNSLPKKEKSLVKTYTFFNGLWTSKGFQGTTTKVVKTYPPLKRQNPIRVCSWKISHGISGGRMDGLVFRRFSLFILGSVSFKKLVFW